MPAFLPEVLVALLTKGDLVEAHARPAPGVVGNRGCHRTQCLVAPAHVLLRFVERDADALSIVTVDQHPHFLGVLESLRGGCPIGLHLPPDGLDRLLDAIGVTLEARYPCVHGDLLSAVPDSSTLPPGPRLAGQGVEDQVRPGDLEWCR